MPPIWTISGFLGLPSDWEFLKPLNVQPFDINHFSWKSLSDWGRKFNQHVKNTPPSILIGYSLGGRLALHSLLDNPSQWKGAVIISSHPGLQDPQEKAKRLEQDRHWANKFQTEDWATLMKTWNEQKLFTHDFAVERKERNYKRDKLSQTLINGSLGGQEDLREAISRLQIPILWLTGSKDNYYSSLAKSLSLQHPFSRWIQVEGAGHRIPWTHRDVIHNICADYLKYI